MESHKPHIQRGQIWEDRREASRALRLGREPTVARCRVGAVDYDAGRVQCLWFRGTKSWRRIDRFLAACRVIGEETREKFFEGLGASEAAAAVGEHPYKPPIQLYSELVGDLEPFEGNQLTHWGNLLEPAIRKEFSDRHDNCEILVPTGSDYHPEESWARATPDGLIPSLKAGIEIKNVGVRSAWRWGDPELEQIPQEYRIQVAWYQWFYDLEQWFVVPLIGGNQYREYLIHRDRELEESLIESCRDFWFNNVQAKKPPPLDGSSAYAEYLARRSSRIRGEYRERSDHGDFLAQEARLVRAEIRRAERELTLIENQIREEIGDYCGIETSEGRIHWKEQRGRTSWKGVAQELASTAGVTREVLDEAIANNTGDPSRPLRVPQKWSRE